ncbi:MAG: hypothetical protein PHI35_07305, partial [Victivallaceae bacterium]|nr:hypothetical protein [Victivallaceae bacterium]
MKKKLDLVNPGMKYRPVPFWSWNDQLEPTELRNQIDEMYKAGIGGFFMHARGGLQTEYLSDRWMECVEACLDEAARFDMQVWLYDENGWPSGFGGGLVNGLGEKYQQKYLRRETIEAVDAKGREHTICYFDEAGEFLGRELPENCSGRVMRYFYEVNPFYVDNLDREVVAEFIKVTHQHYFDRIPKKLQKQLRGIFTDEPQLSRNGLPWSLTLEEAYRNAYGEELLPSLPALFEVDDRRGAARVRFWKLTAEMFRDSFIGQIRQWCDAHKWEVTGHMVLEESFPWQILSNGSATAQYRYFNIPGMDHLCRMLPDQLCMAQLISAAAQFGQKQILSESFALAGWNINFTGMKWIYQPQLAMGVNLLCQHLQGYSLRGLRKRDYPSSNFVHQPWWEDYAKINDRFSRVGMLLAEGEQHVEVMVPHNLSSAWLRFNGSLQNSPISRFENSLRLLSTELSSFQIQHHLADETIVEAVGSFEKRSIRVGKCRYSIAVLPELNNLSRRMYELLRSLDENGGTVIRVRSAEADDRIFIDGEEADTEAQGWFASLPGFDSERAAASAVAMLTTDAPIITENGSPTTRIRSIFRDFKDLDGRAGRFHYIVNTAYKQDAFVSIALPRTGRQVEVIDPDTGAFSILSGVKRDGDFLVFDWPLAALEEAWFFVADHPGRHEAHFKMVDYNAVDPVGRLVGPFTVADTPQNLFTLDRCRYRIDEGEWKFDDVISIQ